MFTAAVIMSKPVISVEPQTSIRDVAVLLCTKRISGVPVVDREGRLVGILSEADLLGHVEISGERRKKWWLTLFSDKSDLAAEYAKAHARRVADVMRTSVVTIEEDAAISDIAVAFQKNGIKRLPVVRDGRVVGIVTRGDLLKALAMQQASDAETSDGSIRDALMTELRMQSWAHPSSLDLTVEDGIVTMAGIVRSESERRALLVAAESTNGVKSVVDRLRLWPGNVPIQEYEAAQRLLGENTRRQI